MRFEGDKRQRVSQKRQANESQRAVFMGCSFTGQQSECFPGCHRSESRLVLRITGGQCIGPMNLWVGSDELFLLTIFER